MVSQKTPGREGKRDGKEQEDITSFGLTAWEKPGVEGKEGEEGERYRERDEM